MTQHELTESAMEGIMHHWANFAEAKQQGHTTKTQIQHLRWLLAELREADDRVQVLIDIIAGREAE